MMTIKRKMWLQNRGKVKKKKKVKKSTSIEDQEKQSIIENQKYYDTRVTSKTS